ncbi:hypothetical protein [Mycobacterium simiae]|uniref:hypothetical protein n=1 Tax=Mycobacterium simiae TaxID=1784 RepID=UPI0039EC8D09
MTDPPVRVQDQPPTHVDLDHEYGPLVEANWVKTHEKDPTTGLPRVNPVWYRLTDMPAEVLLSHTGAKWHYTVDAHGHIRIGSAELGALLPDDELTDHYRFHHQGQHPSTEQLSAFRTTLDKQGLPTIAVEFTADGAIEGGRRPPARISGEIVFNPTTATWEVNVYSGRYMLGKNGWAKNRKPIPQPPEIDRWLTNVATRLARHLGVPITTKPR